MTSQPLESRLLLAASFTLLDGVLTVLGTEEVDVIEVIYQGDLAGSLVHIELNGQSHPLGDFNRVIIEGGGGDDRIDVHQLGHGAGVDIDGGAGDDDVTVTGTVSYNTVVEGGPGADRVYLGEYDGFWLNGHAYVNAGEGDDLVRVYSRPTDAFASQFHIRLIGGPGNDRIEGGGADERLQGGDGDDTLSGRRGDDRLFGGRGKNVLRQGPPAPEG